MSNTSLTVFSKNLKGMIAKIFLRGLHPQILSFPLIISNNIIAVLLSGGDPGGTGAGTVVISGVLSTGVSAVQHYRP